MMAALDQTAPQPQHPRLMAEFSVSGRDGVHLIGVRNLSAGGMMGEGAVAVHSGLRVSVDLPRIGRTEGSVAWVQGERFGVAFLQDIDPDAVFGSRPFDCDDGDPGNGGSQTDRRSETRLR